MCLGHLDPAKFMTDDLVVLHKKNILKLWVFVLKRIWKFLVRDTELFD